MIFKPKLAVLVLAGAKTQTRRLVKEGENQCLYQPPRSYAVQPGRGKKAIGRIRVVKRPEQQLLGLLSLKDARAEGFPHRDAFFDYWRGLHGDVDPFVKVWVITFVRDIEFHPRLLAKTSGYTERPDLALPEEPEAIDEATQDHYSAEAEDSDAERERRRRERWERLTLSQRAAELERVAPWSRADVSRELRLAGRMINQALEKVERHERAA